ncbi:hypothetical protein SAMN05892877_12711 [Rhizobium subbaraonis]|uniref:Uncharacterized protein n=1 Tax=Rhizobium subbaraonis TaxID=908946 RepID=A0A285UYY9_9HYPH|nr:hypothetical protein [Rhizobium subbaraonis]SOC47104.1 hypothetical protein SAMN05892877_12711 [Rhizobium subbaraonis]
MVTQADITGRIDDLEAIVNGLMIYIAAKEAGINLNTEDPKTQDFLKKHVFREMKYRLTRRGVDNGGQPLVNAGDGYWDSLAAGKIPTLVEELKKHFG